MPYSYPLLLLLWSLLWGSLCLLLTVGQVFTAPRWVGLAALACALHALALVLPPWQQLVGLLGFAAAPGNPLYHPIGWVGKAAGLLVSGVFMGSVGRLTAADIGLRGPRRGSLWAVGAVVGVVAGAVFLDAYRTRQAFSALWWPEQVFYSLVPGLDEELFYRGVLLALLCPAFARTIPLPGTRTSWGGLVGVLLFGLGHGPKLWPVQLLVDGWLTKGGGQLLASAWWWRQLLNFPPAEVAYPLAMGLLFLWARERTGSVWVAVAAHCLLNTALTLGHAGR